MIIVIINIFGWMMVWSVHPYPFFSWETLVMILGVVAAGVSSQEK